MYMNLFDTKFVIDGVEQESSLRELVEACNGPYGSPAAYSCDIPVPENGTIIDENTDPDLFPLEYGDNDSEKYINLLLNSDIHGITGLNPGAEARQSIANALAKALWYVPAPYMLDSMSVNLEWTWDTEAIGGYASLYRSVAAAADYAFEIGIRIASCRITGKPRSSSLAASCMYVPESDDPVPPVPVVSDNGKDGTRYMADSLRLKEQIGESTILYIPFDTSDAELGGSALAALLGGKGESTPMMLDPDYFIDSFEVVKELKDDGIILAGREIGRGGLLCALAGLAKSCGIGLEVDILPLQNAFRSEDATKILFNEIPGVLLAISDEDYGYIDTQMVLQDVAYYPVGFATGGNALKIRHKLNYNVADLLLPLMNRNPNK